jgi:SNF2 family DNA or RNA helicase
MQVLEGYDVVLTTYSILAIEGPNEPKPSATPAPVAAKPPQLSAMFRVAWKRLILDEAHIIVSVNPCIRYHPLHHASNILLYAAK